MNAQTKLTRLYDADEITFEEYTARFQAIKNREYIKQFGQPNFVQSTRHGRQRQPQVR